VRRACLALGLIAGASTAAAELPGASSCLACHAALDEGLLQPVVQWKDDVHAAAGLGCEDCHGGDPAPARAEDLDAMSEAAGFRPVPGRLAVAAFCGRCHSDATYMKRFDPQARVDQLAEYLTSTHGLRHAAGDETPATCTDCHGTHGIKPVSRPDSPVYAANVPETCAACHAREATMSPYGITTAPVAEYRRSVHARALLERGDASAPACNDCHGNHGAAPPGVDSVARVCGQCHAREALLFRGSIKSALFDDMDVPECSQCHGPHLVLHPTAELFNNDAAPRVSAGRVAALDPLAVEIERIEAGEAVQVVWRSVLDVHDPAPHDRLLHHVQVTANGSPALTLDATVRPGDATLLPRASGASGPLTATLTFEAPAGLPVQAGDALVLALELAARGSASEGVRVRDQPGPGIHTPWGSVCLECHTRGDACDRATERMYEALQSMERELRQAASLLRRAELWGMEVGQPAFELKSGGTTASVESRALIHAFDPDRLVLRTAEGRQLASRALEAGQAALDELQFRRKGLAVSLVLVALVLLGLYLKIREVDRSRRQEERTRAD
jgi:hypothetical protein